VKKTRLGWLGPAIVLVGLALAGLMTWFMVSSRPSAGAVIDTIAALGAGDLPIVTVFNKIDLIDPVMTRLLVAEWPNSIAISAQTGAGMADLFEVIKKSLAAQLGYIKALVPYDKAQLVEQSYNFGRVLEKEYREDGIWIVAELVPEMRYKLEAFAHEG
jgi:GTP-binding protein HflX